MNKIKNEQREAIVRKAIAERDALLSGAQPAPQAGAAELPDQMDAIALARFKVLPTTSGYWGWCVKAGDGEAELYKGHKRDCDLVARRMVGAFLDGGHKALGLLAAQPTEQPSQDANPPR